MAEPHASADWTLAIKHASTNVPITVPSTALASDLHRLVEDGTGIFARKQKLIYKGKTLDPSRTLAAQGVVNGAKLLLLQTDGNAQTKGQVAASEQKLLLQKQQLEQRHQSTPTVTRPTTAPTATPGARSSGWSERRQTWAKTGVVALRDMKLDALPSDLFDATLGSATVADISHNRLTSLPASLAPLTRLHTLRLNDNALTDSGVPWEALGALTGLTALYLDNNQLASLPPALASLTSLRRVSGTCNVLTSIAAELGGSLHHLEVLLLDGNLLEQLPDELGCCSHLVELSACANRIKAIPVAWAALQKLQTLRLDNNRINSVPTAILSGCTSLSLLSLASNPVTADQLRSADGWEAYDARRRARADKAIDMSVLASGGSTAFQEGADKQDWQHWGPNKRRG